MAAIQKMLEFVDSFEFDEDFATNLATSSDAEVSLKDENTTMSTTDQSQALSTSTIATPEAKRKRIRSDWTSSTGLQRRKRAELEFLREHVKELEAFVQQLKHGVPHARLAVLAKGQTLSDWREVALEELIQRKKSEEANRILKAIVDKQVLAGQTMQEAIQQHATADFSTMDLSLSEDDKILEVAFALIDSCDLKGDNDISATQALGGIPVESRSGISQSAKSKPKTKRIRRPETSSTAFQRRKRAELLALREEANRLEAMLKNLKKKNAAEWTKRSKANFETKAGSGKISWPTEAVKQYHRRLESERLNRKLKDIWEYQLRTNHEIFVVLQRLPGLFVVLLTSSRKHHP
uniref:Uncharacterized protein n=1 Tax=Phytophthora ramorum TaxID=164328 RepID=H3GPW7_PHYRM